MSVESTWTCDVCGMETENDHGGMPVSWELFRLKDEHDCTKERFHLCIGCKRVKLKLVKADDGL